MSRFSIERSPPRRRAVNGRGRMSMRGFSLLEVLVAFVILSLVGTALFRLFSGALRNVSAAEDYSRAVLVAESVITGAAAVQPLREATESGSVDEGRIEWTTRVVPFTPPGGTPDLERAAETMPIRLYRITAEVVFPSPAGGQRTYTLATTRIGPRESR